MVAALLFPVIIVNDFPNGMICQPKNSICIAATSGRRAFVSMHRFPMKKSYPFEHGFEIKLSIALTMRWIAILAELIIAWRTGSDDEHRAGRTSYVRSDVGHALGSYAHAEQARESDPCCEEHERRRAKQQLLGR